MIRVKDIMHETPRYWVLRVPTGYEVYKTGVTHSTRCAKIGWPNSDKGLNRAISEANKREATP